jgi:hypothetical protein
MNLDKRRGLCTVVGMFNPLRIFRHFIYPNVFLAVSIIHLLYRLQLLTNTSASHVVYWLHSSTPSSPQPAQSSTHDSTSHLPSLVVYFTFRRV